MFHGFRDGVLLNAFFSEKGLVVIGRDENPENPLGDAIRYFDFKAIALEERLAYELGLLDGDFDFLGAGITDFKKVIYNKNHIGVAFVKVDSPYDYSITLELRAFEELNSFDEVVACIFCDEKSNTFNFGHSSLEEDEVVETEEFLFRISERLLKFLYRDVFYYKIYNFDNLEDLQCIDVKYNIYEDDLYYCNRLSFGKLYMNNKFQMLEFHVNTISQITNKLEDIDTYFSYSDTVGLFENLEDLGEIVEIDGELFSKNNFASEFILNISKRKQRGAFLEELFEKFIGRY